MKDLVKQSADLDLLDQFAAKAMQSLILAGAAQPKPISKDDGEVWPHNYFYFNTGIDDIDTNDRPPSPNEPHLCRDAYTIAVAMMRQRQLWRNLIAKDPTTLNPIPQPKNE